MAVSAGLMLLGLIQFAMAGMRPQTNDHWEQLVMRLDDGLGTMGAGLAGFLLGVRQMLKRP